MDLLSADPRPRRDGAWRRAALVVEFLGRSDFGVAISDQVEFKRPTVFDGYRCACGALSRSPITKRTIVSSSAARGNLFLSIPALIAPAFDLSKGRAIAK